MNNRSNMEEEEYPQQIPYPMGGMPSEHNSEGSIRFQLSFDDMIDDIEKTLRCEEPYINEHNQVEYRLVVGGKPLINQLGMSRLRTILRSKLNRNAPLSDLEDEEIKRICEDVEMNVRDTINDNWDQFEIPDVSAATTIRETIGDTVFINLKKAGQGRFLRHLRSTHHSSEISSVARAGQIKTQDRSPWMKIFGK